MKQPLLWTALALALVVSLLGLCVVDVVHAAMPGDMSMDCGTRLCDGLTGCAPMSALVPPALPWATVPAAPTLDAPSTAVRVAVVVQPPPPSRHQVRPSAPRSPPLA